MTRNFNKDIMEWAEFPQYDIVWTDPPWQNGMVKLFQTMLYKDTGRVVEHDIDEILNHFFTLADRNKPIILEYSIRGHEKVLEIAERHGHRVMSVNERIQSMNRPFLLLVFNSHVKISEIGKGAEIITNTLRGFDAEIVFDPFAGIGFTAKAVINAGKIYVGSEINEKRYNKLINVNR